MVNLFISEILGFGANHAGLFGNANAYYGTVEQQGRLTLHLQNEVLAKIAECSKEESYKDPTETLPQSPPPLCKLKHNQDEGCDECDELVHWWKYFDNVVDDLVSKSNIHNCERGTNKDGSVSKKYASCKDNKYGKCKARFPRPTFECTEVDPATGALSIKKHEAWINFFTPVLTYLTCCNIDVTCLWSGTALKAVIIYVTDYITKTGLKTHVVFDAIQSVFDKHHQIIASSLSEQEKARKLINKIVNALSTKIEMGAPIVCMYLLGNPDRYTNHTFIPFYWHSFIYEAQKAWEPVDSSTQTDKVTIVRTEKQIVGLSPVYDYIYRPSELDDMNLYDWVLHCKHRKYNKGNRNNKYTPEDSNKAEFTNEHAELTGNSDRSSNSNSEGSDDEEYYTSESDVDDEFIPRSLPQNTYRFKNKHPLYGTHVVIQQPLKTTAVINFIGHILPRCDQGDREFYCLTMLALFKPWRTGLDLKIKAKSWDDTFNNHKFTIRQNQLTQNFNIKYECSDARDVFHAQRKAGVVPLLMTLKLMMN